MKILETLKAWSNSEIKLKREWQNLEVEQIHKQMLELQDIVLYLQGILKQKNQENLELLNSKTKFIKTRSRACKTQKRARQTNTRAR